MPECSNGSVKDLLPDLVHGNLPVAEAARVRAHVATCGDCATELSLIESARDMLVGGTPRLDTAAITAALGAPALRVVRGGPTRPASRGSWLPRRYLAAAASLLVIGALALPSVRQVFLGAPSPGIGDSLRDAAGASPDAVGLALAGGLADLSDDDLATLLADLESVEPTIASEPVTLRSPLVESPEGP